MLVGMCCAGGNESIWVLWAELHGLLVALVGCMVLACLCMLHTPAHCFLQSMYKVLFGHSFARYGLMSLVMSLEEHEFQLLSGM